MKNKQFSDKSQQTLPFIVFKGERYMFLKLLSEM